MPWWAWLVWIATLVVGLALYPQLPASVATHFNASGQPNGYMSKWQAVLFMPGVMLLMMGLWFVMYRIDPKRAEYPKFWPTYRFLGGLITLFLGLIQVWILLHGIGAVGSSGRVAMILVGAVILLLSNWLPRVQPNWLIGIRTMWTLSSEETWRRTHRFAGALGVIVGMVCIVVSILLPVHVVNVAVLVLILLWVAASVLASYVYFRRTNV